MGVPMLRGYLQTKVSFLFEIILAFTLAIMLTDSEALFACTGLMLTAKDQSHVHGRTLEFGIQVDTSITVIPRGYAFEGTTPKGTGLKYTSKYAALGTTAFDNPCILDGINEKGLSVGTFYFPEFAIYAEATTENVHKSLSPADFANWIVTQFETVEEIKTALKDVQIVPTVLKGWGNQSPPFHYIVYDKTGKSLVIEPIEGKLMAYDNLLGVLTNSPNFEWHLLNLRNYINLSNINAKPLNINGMELKSFGQGSGMVGMPGDFTPPSRFVRAAIFTITATPSNTSNEAVFQTFHILNQFDIPVGSVQDKENGVIFTDYTLMTCVREPNTLKYYFKTYEDPTVKVVDLNAFDLNANKILNAKMKGSASAFDISSNLN